MYVCVCIYISRYIHTGVSTKNRGVFTLETGLFFCCARMRVFIWMYDHVSRDRKGVVLERGVSTKKGSVLKVPCSC